MTLSFLLGALVSAAVFQPTATRFIGAVVFVSIAWAHELLLRDLEGFAYHGSAALAALIVIIITSRLTHVSTMIIRLHHVCIGSILLNCAGWFAWLAYLPPEPYNVGMLIVFAWALIALIGKDAEDVGSDSMDRWRPGFRFYPFASHQLLPVNGVET